MHKSYRYQCMLLPVGAHTPYLVFFRGCSTNFFGTHLLEPHRSSAYGRNKNKNVFKRILLSSYFLCQPFSLSFSRSFRQIFIRPVLVTPQYLMDLAWTFYCSILWHVVHFRKPLFAQESCTVGCLELCLTRCFLSQIWLNSYSILSEPKHVNPKRSTVSEKPCINNLPTLICSDHMPLRADSNDPIARKQLKHRNDVYMLSKWS